MRSESEGGARDPLVWLLPSESEASRAQARRVTTFLRLLAADARPRRAEAVGVGVGRVREELERLGRERRALFGAALLRHHLCALLPADSFLAPPRPLGPGGDAAQTLAAWRRELELAGLELPWDPLRASPEERAAALLVALRGLLDGQGAELGTLEAFHAHVVEGPRPGEAAWRRLAEGPSAARLLAARLLAAHGVAAALLDQGRVSAAGRWLAAQQGTLGDSRALGRLAHWVRLLEGHSEPGEARAEAGRLPGPLAAWLARRRAADEAAAAGPANAPEHAADPRPSWALDPDGVLGGCGGEAFVVFARVRGEALPVRWEIAPRWRRAFDPWWTERVRRHRREGTDEHRLCRRASGRLRDRGPGAGALDGALCASTRCLVLEPVVDHAAHVLGWIHLELAHHLAPGPARLRGLARRLVVELARLARPPAAASSTEGLPPVGGERTCHATAREAHALAARLGAIARRRRWWVLDARRRVVATGGGAPGGGRAGGAAAVAEALARGVPCGFEGPDPARACRARSRSGLALPLAFAGRVHGVLALEGERRGELQRHRARLEAVASDGGPRWRAAQFARWHARRFARGVFLCLEPGGWRDGLPALARAARRRRAVYLHGPPGVGRIVIARWLHFEGPGARAPLRVLRGDGSQLLARLQGLPAGATAVVDEHQVSPQVAEAWRARAARERTEGGRRSLLILLGRSPEGGPGPLGPAGPLVRRRLWVPPLRARRDELEAHLALALGERGASPEATALLWRQPWTGNLPELEAFAAALVRRAEARAPRSLARVELQDVRALAAERGLVLVERLPSRPAERLDVEAARRASGPRGERGAAALLGWDPATLRGVRAALARCEASQPGAAPGVRHRG